jgi:hypothetical protein
VFLFNFNIALGIKESSIRIFFWHRYRCIMCCRISRFESISPRPEALM